MASELTLLTLTAGAIGLGHTLLGPDHYLPFIAMAKARKWSLARTTWITLACGLGHVGGSVILGAIGIAAGLAVTMLELTEAFRGDVAAWLLTGFGVVYFVWGVKRAIRNRPHTHRHAHDDAEHEHEHTHYSEHVHVHADDGSQKRSMTPWVLFIVFVFGPCEPLIPILMYPAATHSLWGVALVAGVFAAATLAAMMAVVLAATFGLGFVPGRRLARYSHALAGAVILLCGVAIHLGL